MRNDENWMRRMLNVCGWGDVEIRGGIEIGEIRGLEVGLFEGLMVYWEIWRNSEAGFWRV
jgi:hypothetical protein